MLAVIKILESEIYPQNYLGLVNILVEGGGDLAGFDYIGWIREEIDKVPVYHEPVQHFWLQHLRPDPPEIAARARAEVETQRKEYNRHIMNISKNLVHLLSMGITPYQPGGEEDYAKRVFKLIFTIGDKFVDMPSTMVGESNSKIAVLEIVNLLINTSCMKAHAEFLQWYKLQKQDYEGENTDAVAWIKKSKYLYILLGTWLAKPRTLSHHVRYTIWKTMGQNFHRVDQLGLPKALIAYLKDFIHPQLPQSND